MTETCADCGKPIAMHEESYYLKDPADDIGRTFHSTCGDPHGIKAKDAEIERLRGIEDAADKAAAIYEAYIRERDAEIKRLQEALAVRRELREYDRNTIEIQRKLLMELKEKP
jgi:hypothetical protein